jgi:hypothetical protein
MEKLQQFVFPAPRVTFDIVAHLHINHGLLAHVPYSQEPE